MLRKADAYTPRGSCFVTRMHLLLVLGFGGFVCLVLTLVIHSYFIKSDLLKAVVWLQEFFRNQ